MIEKWKTPVWPVTGREPRTVYVYLPAEAERDENGEIERVFFDFFGVFRKFAKIFFDFPDSSG